MYYCQPSNPTGPDSRLVLSRLKSRSGALALATICSILLLYLLQIVGIWVLSWSTPFMDSPPYLFSELYTALLIYPLVFFLPYLLYARATGYRLRYIPHDPPRPDILAASTGISLGLSVAGAILSVVVLIFFASFGLMPPDLPLDLPPTPTASAVSILNITLVPALFEELTFRGIVLGSLRPYGDRFAILVSALLFALMHRNMVQLPNALLLGLALGYFLVKTNSIFTSMTIHFINNLLVLLFSILTAPMSDPGYLLAEGLLFFVYILSGLLGLAYLMGVRRLDMRLFPSACPVRASTLLRRFFINFPMLLLLCLFGWIIYLSFA